MLSVSKHCGRLQQSTTDSQKRNHTENNFNLAVTRVPAYSPHAVAEHTIGLLLSLNRKIHRAYNRVRDLNFSLNGLIGYDITGKTAGIIGTGKIGRIVAQILRGFDAKVIVYDPIHDFEWARKYEIDYVDLPTLLEKSDIISLHVPYIAEHCYIYRSYFLCSKYFKNHSLAN